jgi:DNA-binding NarL/FixJ family response regulator
MRSILVCVRTPLAAQAVASCAARLGLGEVIHTAIAAADALARLAETNPDVVLADTSAVRPDAIGFTRRVLERVPDAVIVFFGPEDPATAQAAVAAGARGVIRGGEHEELVASVAKALMLLLRPARAAVPLQRSESGEAEEADATEATPTTVLGEAVLGDGRDAGAEVVLEETRQLALTERELQVLRGMADGKSNAEIGRELFVSEDTVKTHARRLFRKLSARDRAHAVAAAFRAGLVR